MADAYAFDGAGGVIQVDPTTGVQTAIYSGEFPQNPNDIAFVPIPEPSSKLGAS